MERLAIVLVLAALAGSANAAPEAHAGTYSVSTCADAEGKPLSAGDWSPSTAGTQALTTTTCGANVTGATAGNLQAITGGGPNNPATGNAAWNIQAAGGTKITGLSVWWTNTASAQAPGRIQIFAGPTSLYARDAGAFGNVATPLADGNRQTFTGFSQDSAALVAWCTATCTRPDRAISAYFNAYRIQLTIADDVAPAGEASGTTDGMFVTGTLALQARATDAGGGVRDVQLLVDGRVVDAKQATGSCGDISPSTGDERDYALMRPCTPQLPEASAAPASFTVTPAMLATAGLHTIAIVAHDAAGNSGTLLSHTVFVAPAFLDGPPPASRFDPARNLFFNPDADVATPPRPNGLGAGPAKVGLAFVARRVVRSNGRLRVRTRFTRRRLVGYNTTSRMRGRLTTLTGQPIIGARVHRAVSVASGPWRLMAKPLITSKTGRVSVKLAARSPSRRVQLVYFPTTSSNDSFRSPARLLRVRAPVSLSLARRSVPRGGRVNLTARLRAGIRPGATVIGALQLRQAGNWRTIRQLRFTPRSRGRARTALRLSTPATYRLRVRVSAQPGLRYTTGSSRPRALRVR